jgi:DNA-binding PadR family transcriptional regulator
VSLRNALLGLLAEGPASGYDLARQFQDVLGPVWPAQHPKIYAELGRLAEDGLIQIDSRGPRGRKTYRITESGLTEVRRWLTEDEVDHTLRVDSLLRSFFFWLMPPHDLNTHLAKEARYFSQTAAAYREHAKKNERGEFGDAPQITSRRVTTEAGIRLYQALADWAEWARTVPPCQQPTDTTNTPPPDTQPADPP